MKSSILVFLSISLLLLSGCGQLGEQLGMSKEKKPAAPVTCYGHYYDPAEDVYKNGAGRPVNCEEDIDSIQYRVYWNLCTGGDELIGYNFDAQGNRQYCSNSPCSMEDRKRGFKVFPNGQITVECGFSTPSYIQDFYRGYNTGYQYTQPVNGNYIPYGQQGGYNSYGYRTW
ncbi:MAG: hypothetical protein R2827_13180 [Bdellovibrionales bacterium]